MTLCSTAGLKSPCRGGKGSGRRLPRAIMLKSAFKSYLTDFFHKITKIKKGILRVVWVRKMIFCLLNRLNVVLKF
jgi:hypothetical protein